MKFDLLCKKLTESFITEAEAPFEKSLTKYMQNKEDDKVLLKMMQIIFDYPSFTAGTNIAKRYDLDNVRDWKTILPKIKDQLMEYLEMFRNASTKSDEIWDSVMNDGKEAFQGIGEDWSNVLRRYVSILSTKFREDKKQIANDLGETISKLKNLKFS